MLYLLSKCHGLLGSLRASWADFGKLELGSTSISFNLRLNPNIFVKTFRVSIQELLPDGEGGKGRKVTERRRPWRSDFWPDREVRTYIQLPAARLYPMFSRRKLRKLFDTFVAKQISNGQYLSEHFIIVELNLNYDDKATQ